MGQTFLDVPIADTGLVLVLLPDGTLFIERSATFVPTYDYAPEGITGFFDANEFSLQEPGQDFQRYDYGVAYPYKNMPVLKAWLIQQQLQLN